MIEAICDYLRNDFADPREILRGAFTIRGGSIDLPPVAEGRYFRVVGSAFNDGVHAYPARGLTDETFVGEIRPMRVPRAVRELAAEIEAWQAKYGGQSDGPYAEERLGEYHYKKAQLARRVGDGRTTILVQPTWQRVFDDRLRRWRKL